MMNRRLYFVAVVIAASTICFGCGEKSEYIHSALECAQQQKYEDATDLLAKAEEAGESPKLLLRARGIVAIGLADYEEAKRCFEEALTYANGHVNEAELDISHYLAVAQYKSGDIQAAEDTYTALLGMQDKDSGLYFLRGSMRLELDRYDDAIRDFNQAVDNDKNNPDRYIQIYETLENAGYDEAANDYLGQIMSIDTKLTDFQKGKVFYCQGNYESARDYLEKARSANVDGVILYLGKAYEALGDMNYAASLYKSYLEDNPEDVEILNQLGLCQMIGGDYDGALKSFEAGLAVDSIAKTQALKYNEILAYEYKGDFQQAATLMKAYISTYPDDEEAAREYEFLKTR